MIALCRQIPELEPNDFYSWSDGTRRNGGGSGGGNGVKPEPKVGASQMVFAI
jgi:hypothetical protein